jgi:3-deoxy-manno-octulosonate cytidylyltransferase (CMP-KDO synthetase)
MNILGIIPARMAASRFPNKPLVPILGLPMVGHCYLRSNLCKEIDDLYIASCDNEILDFASSIGGSGILTSSVHERATERTAEALLKLENLNNTKYDIIVMIQGDEPLVFPQMISEILYPLMNYSEVQVSNLMVEINSEDDIINSNNVKVVCDRNGDALYMSREPIPSKAKYTDKVNYFRQLGLIAFRRDALLNFIALEPSNLEIIESVDMNRLLENGVSIRMVECKYDVDAVDTPADLIRVEDKMRSDTLFEEYKNY